MSGPTSFIGRLRASLTRWFDRFVPVPLAAPESATLARARQRIIVALAALAVLTACWPWGLARTLALGAGLFVGLTVFLVVQVPLWARAKSRADDAWLLRAREEEPGQGAEAQDPEASGMPQAGEGA